MKSPFLGGSLGGQVNNFFSFEPHSFHFFDGKCSFFPVWVFIFLFDEIIMQATDPKN